jgi:hypothetical protein
MPAVIESRTQWSPVRQTRGWCSSHLSYSAPYNKWYIQYMHSTFLINMLYLLYIQYIHDIVILHTTYMTHAILIKQRLYYHHIYRVLREMSFCYSVMFGCRCFLFVTYVIWNNKYYVFVTWFEFFFDTFEQAKKPSKKVLGALLTNK